jgi:hypothetical protein
MEHLGNGLVTIFNGLWVTLTSVVSPATLGGLVLAACLLWLARLELDELDRLGSKPTVDRH